MGSHCSSASCLSASASLLQYVSFFDYWAWRHDYNNGVVSVRAGRPLSKADKDWTKRQGSERHLVCIEDPFELCHDLGRTIDKHSVQVRAWKGWTGCYHLEDWWLFRGRFTKVKTLGA